MGTVTAMTNREILFRGKRDNVKWVYGDLNTIHEPNQIYIRCKDGTNYLVNPKTVGQYTGFTDKEGIKIFEGDIISYFNKDFLNSEVIFDKGAFMFRFISEFTQRIRQQKQDLIFANVEMCGKVIGNVWDNPELLGGDSK